MTLEQAIEHAEDIAISAIGCECREEHRQLAAWLRELQERRKADSCEGCMHDSKKHYICLICARHYGDKYVTEGRTDADD